MRTAFTILLIIIAVLASGCTVPAPATTTLPSHGAETSDTKTTQAIPDLTGTWTGPMQGYDEGVGFTDYSTLTAVMTVSEQHGRLFSGYFVFRMNGTETKSGFAGVIGRDNRTLTIAEKDGGYCSGTVLGQDEIELIYMQDGSPYSIAIDSFKRV